MTFLMLKKQSLLLSDTFMLDMKRQHTQYIQATTFITKF
jgi:hypothetical protein